MLNTLKRPFIKLCSYIRPVKLGYHMSTDTVDNDVSINIDNLVDTCIDFNKNAVYESRNNKSESIVFHQPIEVALKSTSSFELLSINMSKTNETKNLVRIREKGSKQVFRISMNTFRALFTLKDK